MKIEFPRVFQELFEKARDRLRQELMIKIEFIKNYELQVAFGETDRIAAMRAKFAYAFLGGMLKEMNKPNYDVALKAELSR